MRIAFDIGNVLVNVDFEGFFTEFNRMGTRDDPFEFLCDLQHQQDIGITTLSIALRAKFGSSVPKSMERALVHAWNKSIKPNKEMLDFVDDLKRRDVKVAILSNMGTEHADFIRKTYPRMFEGCKLHLSGEVGARKPSKLYFQSFLMQHPNFQGCLFLDDRRENLAAAEEFGIDGQHFELDKFTKLPYNEREEVLKGIRAAVYNQMLHGTKRCIPFKG